jgi:hypothetical protein
VHEAAVADVCVSSWAELQDALFAEPWHGELGRFRSDFAYRGEADAATDLRTSLVRLAGAYADVESHLLGNFRKYARREAVPEDTEWSWLALAKHHGLPTRLLDWTYSPYVRRSVISTRSARTTSSSSSSRRRSTTGS